MTSMRALANWFALFDFRADRAEFYRDFAEMYQRNEAMVSFLEGEIANANLTRQRSRARVLRIVLHRHQDGDHASRVSHLLDGVVPRSDAMLLTAVDREIARGPAPGWTTAVVVEIRDGRVHGASVGDSAAFLVAGETPRELTAGQWRKPLVGSGEAHPVAFGPTRFEGRLLVATDGLAKALPPDRLARLAAAGAPATAIAALLDAARLRSGALQDDVAIVLVEPGG